MTFHRHEFWDHSKQHSSKTLSENTIIMMTFWDHSKQHSSKTARIASSLIEQFWDHSKQHSSKTYRLYEDTTGSVLGPFETAQL